MEATSHSAQATAIAALRFVGASVQHVPPASRWHRADLLRGNCCRKRLVQTDVCIVDDSVMFNLWYYSGDSSSILLCRLWTILRIRNWWSFTLLFLFLWCSHYTDGKAEGTSLRPYSSLRLAGTESLKAGEQESDRMGFAICMGWPGAKCKTQESIWQCVKTLYPWWTSK